MAEDKAPDIARIFTLMLELAKNNLIGKKELSLAHLYAFKPDGALTIFALDPAIFAPDGTKSLFAAKLRHQLRTEGYEAYGFCCEVWITNKLPAELKDGLPENDPERREALTVIVGTRERGYARRYEMNRRPNGTVRKLTEMAFNPDDTGGRFGHLLTPAAWDGAATGEGFDAMAPADPGGRLRH